MGSFDGDNQGRPLVQMALERMNDRILVCRERGKLTRGNSTSTGQETVVLQAELTVRGSKANALPGVPHSVPIIILGGENSLYLHVMDVEIETQRSYVTCQGSHS